MRLALLYSFTITAHIECSAAMWLYLRCLEADKPSLLSLRHYICDCCEVMLQSKRCAFYWKDCRLLQALLNATDDEEAMQALLAEAAKAELQLRHDCVSKIV